MNNNSHRNTLTPQKLNVFDFQQSNERIGKENESFNINWGKHFQAIIEPGIFGLTYHCSNIWAVHLEQLQKKLK